MQREADHLVIGEDGVTEIEEPEELRQVYRHLVNVTGQDRIYIEWAYGRPRLLEQLEGSTGCREVSPRLAPDELIDWMRAYIAGYGAGYEGANMIEQAAKEAAELLAPAVAYVHQREGNKALPMLAEWIDKAAAMVVKIKRFTGEADASLTVEAVKNGDD